MYKIENQLKFEDFIFPYGKLNENNRWIKLSKIIPWDEIEIKYAKNLEKRKSSKKCKNCIGDTYNSTNIKLL